VIKSSSDEYLKSTFGTLWAQIKGEVNLGLLGGKTPHEVAEAIGTIVDKGRFRSAAERAQVITQTEMGRAYSQATQSRLEQAAQSVPKLEKMWIHAGHPKQARPGHLLAHGQHVPVNDLFNVGTARMRYPRDPGAPISEVIRCGCDHAAWHPDWGITDADFPLPKNLEYERQQLLGNV
jgi:hypothetical protein